MDRRPAEPNRLRLAKWLQAVVQHGLTYAKDPDDLEQYQLVREMAVLVALGLFMLYYLHTSVRTFENFTMLRPPAIPLPWPRKSEEDSG